MAADLTVAVQMDFPVGESWLESMPEELLTKIMKSLGLDDALGQHGCVRDQATFKKGISELLGLCLASKRLEAVVRPVIYDEVLICGTTELVLLFRTLTKNHQIGEYIKKLAFSTTFKGQNPDYEPLDREILRGLDTDLELMLPKGSATMTGRQENEIRTSLYLKVLERAPNVKHFAMNPASWSVRGLEGRDLAPFGMASIQAYRKLRLQIPTSRLPKSLTTLTLNGNYQGWAEGLPTPLSNFLCQEVSDETKLKEMRWSCDDTTWFASLPGHQWASNGLRGQLTCLTTLHLLGTSCRFSDLAIVCDSFPMLKDLFVFSNFVNRHLGYAKTDRMDGLSPGPTRLCLTRNISKLRHLESLRLELATVPNDKRLLGGDGGLDLSSLSKLKRAAISFRLFVFNKKTSETASTYNPSRFLPQSLERLDITVLGYKCEAGGDLMNFLEGLHIACKYGFPRLRLVEYEYMTGIPGLQTIDPRCICVCGKNDHEGHCTYDAESDLQCAFLPWVPAEKFQALDERFGQRGIKLEMRGVVGFAVTGGTITTAS